QKLGNFLQNIPQKLGQLGQKLGNFLQNIPQKLGNLGTRFTTTIAILREKNGVKNLLRQTTDSLTTSLKQKKLLIIIKNGYLIAKKGIIGLVKIAKKGLIAIMAANPIFAIALAIWGLVEAFTSLWEVIRNPSLEELSDRFGVSRAQIEHEMEQMGTTSRRQWREMAEASRNFAEEHGQDEETVRGQMKSLIEHFGNTRNAERALDNLRHASNDLAWEFDMDSETIQAQLVSLIGSYINAQESVEDVWRNLKASSNELAQEFGMDSEVIQEQLISLMGGYINTAEAAENAWRNLKDASNELADRFGVDSETIQGELVALTAHYEGNEEAAIAAWESIAEKANELAEEFVYCVDTMRKKLLALEKSYEDSEKAIQRWRDNQIEILGGLGSEWGMSGEEVAAHMRKMGMSADEWSEHMGSAWNEFQNNVQSNVNGIINGFRKIPTEYGKSAEELRKIMQQNTETTRQWQENMGRISEKVGPEMFAILKAKGPGFNSVIEEMLDSPEELAKWKDTFEDAMEAGLDGALQKLDDDVLQEAFLYKLNDTGRVISYNRAMEEALGENIIETIEYGVDLASEGGEEIGEAYVEHIAEAIENGSSTIIPTVEDLIEDINDTFERGFSGTSETIGIGLENVNEVMTDGMDNTSSIIQSAMGDIDDNVDSTLLSITNTARTRLSDFENTFEDMQTSVTSSSSQAMEQVEENINSGLETVSINAVESLGEIEELFEEFKGSLGEISTGMVDDFNTTLSDGLDTANATSEEGVASLESTFKTLEPSLTKIGANSMQGLENGLQSKKPSVMSTAQGIANSVSQTMASALRINSPSRVMLSLGGYTMDGFAIGLEAGSSQIETIAKNTAYTVKDSFEQAIGSYKRLNNMISGHKMDGELKLAITPPDASYESTLLERLIDTVQAGQYIVMDSGELVGATYAGYDNAAGQAISYNSRWGR
ncbi:MAG: hypothetical protein FWF50_03000, partial [Defluviitaleaceae bacterium]|nr:hypothetical protein [Defluviitaleaceae bacterium]